MSPEQLLQRVRTQPERVEFSELIEIIDANYDFTPVGFRNGTLVNSAGQNAGSCRVFAFARLHGLDQQQTLDCFGACYRDEVLNDPDGDSHQNIRQFMRSGWAGIHFEGEALRAKQVQAIS